MARPRPSRFIAAALAVGLLAVTGCSHPRQVSGEEFVRAANRIGEMHSASWTSYIGTNGSRAYLEQGRPGLFGGAKTTVICTRLPDLPADLAADLKAGKNPWKAPVAPSTSEGGQHLQ